MIHCFSKLKLFDNSDPQKMMSINSVDYEPETLQELDKYEVLLIKEVCLRDLHDWETMDQLQASLKDRLVDEKRLADLLRCLEHCKAMDGALFLVEQALPCILHLENWTLIKIMTMLLIEGLSNAQGKLLPNSNQIRSMHMRGN